MVTIWCGGALAPSWWSDLFELAGCRCHVIVDVPVTSSFSCGTTGDVVDDLDQFVQTVAVPAVSLTLEGVGRFPPVGNAHTLWAGVRVSAELMGLHAAAAAALATPGYRPDARRYHPHITLARCKPLVPAGVAAEFLARHAAFSFSEVPVVEFGLYSSTLFGDAPVYRRERSFPLWVAGGVS